MPTKGLKLENELFKTLGKNLSLAREDEWDRQGIDALFIGQKRKPALVFDTPIALQITTTRGDLEKINEFKKRTSGLQKVVYLEFLDQEIDPITIELITAIILGLNFEDSEMPRTIIRIERGRYQRFNLPEVAKAFENWLASNKMESLVPGVLAFWESRCENREDLDQTESQLPPPNAYGFIERELYFHGLSTKQPFNGFVRYHAAAADMDHDLLKELQNVSGNILEHGLTVLFNEGAREKGFKRKRATNVILKDRSDFTTTQPTPPSLTEQTTSSGSLRSLLSRLVSNHR